MFEVDYWINQDDEWVLDGTARYSTREDAETAIDEWIGDTCGDGDTYSSDWIDWTIRQV